MNLKDTSLGILWSWVPMCGCWAALLSGGVATAQSSVQYAIAIHGGAGGDPGQWSAEYRQNRLDGLEEALEVGLQMLQDGRRAVEVAEAVLMVLEDNPTFNAGRGCVLNAEGQPELDASIMDGSTLQCGAAAAIHTTRNPIRLARLVMEKTPHVLLVGPGADTFAQQMGLDQVDTSYFITPQRKEQWEKWRARQSEQSNARGPTRNVRWTDATVPYPDEEGYFGTVGCVVRDREGNLAAATSTGGLPGKMRGRVGDSPIIGAGNYADNRTCAVSGTGIGEEFIRHTIAADIAARMRYSGATLAVAARDAIAQLPSDGGGIIAVDAAGHIVVEYNTIGMSHAFADSSGRRTIRLGRKDSWD